MLAAIKNNHKYIGFVKDPGDSWEGITSMIAMMYDHDALQELGNKHIALKIDPYVPHQSKKRRRAHAPTEIDTLEAPRRREFGGKKISLMLPSKNRSIEVEEEPQEDTSKKKRKDEDEEVESSSEKE